MGLPTPNTLAMFGSEGFNTNFHIFKTLGGILKISGHTKQTQRDRGPLEP